MPAKRKSNSDRRLSQNVARSPSIESKVRRKTPKPSVSNITRCSVGVTERMEVDGMDEAIGSADEEGGTRVDDIYIPPPIPPYCSTESKGPRLIIEKIENYNFKSYAGKVVLGPFHHCFTAIIGPNGSGKSNVIDSMLFVFGYRANKIRCKKISTLLHNSAKYPNTSMCSVAVHFYQIIDRQDGTYERVPDSKFIVERTAYRDNSSFYTINKKRVQFKEVANLLRKHNVDLDHNRFLILQGEVESIAMMKPKGQNEGESGMLEYLEDIVGTTRYKEPLLKINNRVEQMTEERTEKHNRCKLAEREMNDLEQPYNDAVEFLRHENDSTRTKNLRIQKYISEMNRKVRDYTKDYDVVLQGLQKHDDAAVALRKEIEEKEQLAKKESRQFEEFRKNKEELEKCMEIAKGTYMKIQQTMAVVNKRRKENKVQVEKSEVDIVELRKIPNKKTIEIEECEAKAEKLSKQKEDLEVQLQKNFEKLEKQTKPLIEEREKYESELVELQRRVDEDRANLTLSEQELKILKHDETTETRKFETMKTSYEDSKKNLADKHQKVQDLKQRTPLIQAEMATIKKKLNELQKEEERISNKLIALRAEINEKVANMHVKRTNNKVTDFLMRLKTEGKLPGFLGRLGDLGGIDAKYDVAISTACGRLDNIVVDTVTSAQECIEHMKRSDVGRASFIALDKVAHFKNVGRIQTPENASRLYDLVRVEDERVLPAFYFALRNTLVADTLEAGTRIAYSGRRFRVVTLNGDMIETSGTMAGGGRGTSRGKMGTEVQTKTKNAHESSFVSKQALEDMQVQAEKLQSDINYNQEEQGRLDREFQQLNRSYQKTEDELEKLSITIKSLDEQLPRIHKQLEAQRQRMEQTHSDASKVEGIEIEVEKKKQRLNQSEKAATIANDNVLRIKKEIDTIHDDIIKVVQTKIKNLSTQINKLASNLSKLKVEVTSAERNVLKMEKRILDLHADIIKAQDELTSMSKDRQKFDDETITLAKELEEAQTAIDVAKSQSSGIFKDIQELQKAESDNKLKRVELDEKVQNAKTKLNEVKDQIPHWHDQLKPLILHQIPGDSEPVAPLKTYTDEELASYTLQDIQYKESVQDEALKKKPNLSCIRDYIEKRDVYLERVKVLEDITSRRNEMRQLYDEVRKKRYNEFMQGFQIITRKLKEMYRMITQGGDAEIELVDSMDPFTEGVSFSVRPPKKTWKNISNLSGGEKTLSSLALVFALHYYKPSPLYFMDEIDAALDFKNISIVAHYIKERTKNAQFIIISLRSNMFELSDYVVGIFKVTDCTDSLTIKNRQSAMQLVTPTMLKRINPFENMMALPDYDDGITLMSPVHDIFGNDQIVNRHNNENNPNPANDSNTVLHQTINSQLQSIVPTEASTEKRQTDSITQDSTFLPQIESTAISQISSETLLEPSQDIEMRDSENSISDTFFKMPPPPSRIDLP